MLVGLSIIKVKMVFKDDHSLVRQNKWNYVMMKNKETKTFNVSFTTMKDVFRINKKLTIE